MAETSPPNFEFDSQSLPYLQRLLETYRQSPEKVPDEWHAWFKQLVKSNGKSPSRISDKQLSPTTAAESSSSESRRTPALLEPSDGQRLQNLADQMIASYRTSGYRCARLDPLGMADPSAFDLSLERFGMEEDQLQQTVYSAVGTKQSVTTLGELYQNLQSIYCGQIGFEFMHMEDAEARQWVLRRVEEAEHPAMANNLRQRIARLLREAVLFEEFVRKKYIGAKTFSLEGSETLIPLLDMVINQAAEQDVSEIVIGMPHRGRLNVLANIIGQPLRELFAQFNDQFPESYRGGGDVKYHLGASGDRQTLSGQEVHLSLCFNPSHLEFVNPVALGRLRAKQDRTGDRGRRRGMSILIHGDAGFAGEGIVQESLNLSDLSGYETGGTLHVIVNNQLGFTTPPSQGRSARTATAVARMLDVPILHVNGEYPEAVIRAVQLAMDFRFKFQRDAIIDMHCFRRFGHNEADEPSFTQPLMYQAIEHHPDIGEKYEDRTESDPNAKGFDVESSIEEYETYLKDEYELAQDLNESPVLKPSGIWEDYCGGPEPDGDHREDSQESETTGVENQVIARLLEKLTETPQDFHIHQKLQRSIDHRREMAQGERPIDWSAAEALAFATLATEGHHVRLSGQDSERGTFSHRHAALYDAVNGNRHQIFSNLSKDQAPVEIYNSPLSEAGVLGFEYGFSLDYPSALVAWEAQFGDFCNAAQVIIDQFISSAEDKWNRLTGIVLILPHGFEGQGPEHSSARLERFLMLAAEDNIQVAVPTTPAQYFHLLRRQVIRRWRKPLVVLTPKSLLRSSQAVSDLDDLSSGRFHKILPDEREQTQETRQILMCSGKVYYDLVRFREEQECEDTAVIRVEQLYPLSDELLKEAVGSYAEDLPVTWVQEEPENMGAWPYWRRRCGDYFLQTHPFEVVARRASASPATGSKAAHKLEQQELIEKAFD